MDPQEKKKIGLEYQIDYPPEKHVYIHEGSKEDTLE